MTIEFDHNDLQVGSDGRVDGDARITGIREGYDVHGTVKSYGYTRDGEAYVNHVPMVTITRETGEIVKEPHVPDTEHAEVAVERVESTLRAIARHPDRYF